MYDQPYENLTQQKFYFNTKFSWSMVSQIPTSMHGYHPAKSIILETPHCYIVEIWKWMRKTGTCPNHWGYLLGKATGNLVPRTSQVFTQDDGKKTNPFTDLDEDQLDPNKAV